MDVNDEEAAEEAEGEKRFVATYANSKKRKRRQFLVQNPFREREHHQNMSTIKPFSLCSVK